MGDTTSADVKVSNTLMYTVLSEGSIMLKKSNWIIIPVSYSRSRILVEGRISIVEPSFMLEVIKRIKTLTGLRPDKLLNEMNRNAVAVDMNVSSIKILELYTAKEILKKYMTELEKIVGGK
jgi:hypothetical protein